MSICISNLLLLLFFYFWKHLEWRPLIGQRGHLFSVFTLPWNSLHECESEWLLASCFHVQVLQKVWLRKRGSFQQWSRSWLAWESSSWLPTTSRRSWQPRRWRSSGSKWSWLDSSKNKWALSLPVFLSCSLFHLLPLINTSCARPSLISMFWTEFHPFNLNIFSQRYYSLCNTNLLWTNRPHSIGESIQKYRE